MKDVGGAVLAGSTPPFRGRERAAVNVGGKMIQGVVARWLHYY